MSEKKEIVYTRPKLKLGPGSGTCPGCHHSIVQKVVCEVLEEMNLADNAIGVAGVGCSFGFFAAINVDGGNCAHGAAPAVATGIKHALFGKPLVFTVQGDGDCAAIGGGYLLNAAARAEKITVIMVNNANYGTTGGQLAPTTIMDQVTSTTPHGRDPRHGYPVHLPELLAGMKGVAFTARAALFKPAGYQRAKSYLKTAFQRQLDNAGLSFVELLSACPPNWHMTPLEAIEWMEDKMLAEYPEGVFKDIAEVD